MFSILEFDCNGAEVAKASFSSIGDCFFYLDNLVRPRAAQIAVWNNDENVLLRCIVRNARTPRHGIDRYYRDAIAESYIEVERR